MGRRTYVCIYFLKKYQQIHYYFFISLLAELLEDVDLNIAMNIVISLLYRNGLLIRIVPREIFWRFLDFFLFLDV